MDVNNSITIDKGQKKFKDGKIAFKWDFTLSEEGDYDTGTIKYHEIFYDIDKTAAVIGEEENEKWITINKRDCKDIPTLDFFKYFQKFLLDHKKKEADLLEELKKHLNKVNIKFEKGDWQSFPNNYAEMKSKPSVKPKSKKLKPNNKKLPKPIFASRPLSKLLNLIDQFKAILIIYAFIFIVSFEFSLSIFSFVIFSLLGLGCLFLVFEGIRENKNFKSVIASIPYFAIGLGCLYLAYGAIYKLI